MSTKNIPHVDRRVLLSTGGVLMLSAVLRPIHLFAQRNSTSRIGIIGAGNIGSTIGGLWIKSGHSVMFSSRHPDELKDMVTKLGSLAQAGSVEQAIAFGEVLFITVPYGAIPQIGKDYSAGMKGKVMLDACNAVSTRDGAVADEVEQNGIGVTSQKYFPDARIVRAFNTMSYTTFAREANRPAPKIAIPIAGDDARPCKSRRTWYAMRDLIQLLSVNCPTPGGSSADSPAMGNRYRPRSLNRSSHCHELE